MTKLFRGLYRTTAGAYVADDAMAFNVPEAEYRAFGYEPDYNSLPWKESYVAAKAGKAAQAEQTRMPTDHRQRRQPLMVLCRTLCRTRRENLSQTPVAPQKAQVLIND
jgi:hypothetical protein